MGKLAFPPALEGWVKRVNDGGERQPGWTYQEGGRSRSSQGPLCPVMNYYSRCVRNISLLCMALASLKDAGNWPPSLIFLLGP